MAGPQIKSFFAAFLADYGSSDYGMDKWLDIDQPNLKTLVTQTRTSVDKGLVKEQKHFFLLKEKFFVRF